MQPTGSDSGDRARDRGSSDSDVNNDNIDSQEAGDQRGRSPSVCTADSLVRSTEGEGEDSPIAILLHDKTRVGEDYQATFVPRLRARTEEAKQEDLKIAPKKDHLLWDASRAPDERRLQQLVKRLNIGTMKSGTRRPISLLTHADVMAALHRCKYDPASAEASLVALARRREAKHNRATASTNARNSEQINAEPTIGVVAENAAAGKGTSKPGPKAPSAVSRGGESDASGNRWEDWSEDDRAAFLMHLGDKHKDMDDVVEEFPAKSHADTIEFYYNWKFHEPDYSRWQFMKRQIDIALTYPDFHQEICEICEEGGELLLCDTCSLAFHLHCLSPRLEDPPDNDWSCPECIRKHITPESRARAKLFVKQRIVSIEEQRRSMAKDEERRHERQAVYGYLGQANAGIEQANKRGGGGNVTTAEKSREKAMVDEEAEAQAERELSNRPWGKEDLAQLQRAVDEFGERGWRAIMADGKYKSLFHMRSPLIVKSMHRLMKDNDLKRARARARIAARADTKAKARGEVTAGADGEVVREVRDGTSFTEADAAAAAVAMARTKAHESVDHKQEEAGGPGTFDDPTRSKEQRILLLKLVQEHGVNGLQSKINMPEYKSLKEIGSPSELSNRWRSMQHRLRRRLERQGMVPKRKPGRPPKNPPTQPSLGLSNGIKVAPPTEGIGVGMMREAAAVMTKVAGGHEREYQPKGEAPVQVVNGGVEGERNLKRVRTEQKTENEHSSTTEGGLPTRMQL